MKEQRVSRRWGVGSVQANNVETLIFHPDAAQEAAFARILFGRDIKHQAAHVAQKFAANVVKVIMLAVEVGAVRINHPREAQRLVLHLEELLEAAHQAVLHARVLLFQIVFPVDRLPHVHAPEEIMIAARY